MNKKELFKNFYYDLYKDILDEYYLEIEKYIKKNHFNLITSIIIFSLIPTILLWIFFFQLKYIFFFIVITITYNIGIYFFLKSSHKDNSKIILNQIKYKILDDIITLISGDDTSSVLPNNRISKVSFEKTNLFNLKNVEYTGANYIQTHIDDKTLILADMNIFTYIEKQKQEYFYIGNKKFLRSYKAKKKKDIFTGCYIGSDNPKKNSNLIQIIPNTLKTTIINNKINKYYDLCDTEVKLENLDFSKKYSVYTNDEIKARMTLTLTMMEHINELEKILNNKKYIIFKNDGRYSMFIENFTFEEILNKNLSPIRNKEKELDNIYKIFTEIYKLFEIVTIMNNSK
ncbi:MAG: DUF3137 domain-containing protein [Bacilli bacterium]|nr:DUF3137 domain-containing protein [Bacilli bacterium]